MLEELTCSYKNRCNYKWIKNYDVGFFFVFFPIRWKYKRLIICKSLWWTRNKTRPRRQRGKSNPASCPHSVADYFPKTAQRAERYSLRVRRFDSTSRSLGQNVSWKPTGVRVQISDSTCAVFCFPETLYFCPGLDIPHGIRINSEGVRHSASRTDSTQFLFELLWLGV